MWFFGKDDKDDSSESKKDKKKEESWGKKERLIVLIILALTMGSSAVLALSARSWKLPGMPRLSKPNISIPFFEEKTIIIESRKDEQSTAQFATEEFQRLTLDLSGVYGFYVVNLETGYTYGLYENETFQAASLVKLPVMAGMYMQAEAGDIDLDDTYELQAEHKTAGSGSLYNEPTGTELTYRELIEYMGQESDNTAFAAAIDILGGEERVQEIIDEIGMTSTSIETNETTPTDVGLFFEDLVQGDLMRETHRDELLDYMTDTIYETWLPAGIPSDVRVAHKFGRETQTVNDAGVVFAENLSEPDGSSPNQDRTGGQGQEAFVVVIMSKGVIERDADEVFPELSRVIYRAQTSN